MKPLAHPLLSGNYLVFQLLLLCIATACRMYAVDDASLWADELWGVDACSQGSWWSMIHNLIYKDSHPPGYQSMLYVWMKVFGDSDLAVRMPSVIAGVAAVAALYRLGMAYFSPVTAILAALLLAVSHNAIYYSQEARAYIFLLLFAILHYHVFLQIFVSHDTRWRHWLVFWLTGAILAYLHYVGVVIVLSGALLLPFIAEKGERKRLLYKAFLPVLLLYLPWLPVMFKHLLFPDKSWVTAVPDSSVLLHTARFLWGPDNTRFYLGVVCLAVFVIGCVRSLIKDKLSSQQKVLLQLLLLSLLPLAAFYLKSHLGSSAYTIRHFTYVIPVLALVTASCMASFIRWRGWSEQRTLFCLVLLLAFISVELNVSRTVEVGGKLYNDMTKTEYRQAVDIVASDSDFIRKGGWNVFIANKFFDHYLMRRSIRNQPAVFFHQDQPQKLGEYIKFIKKQDIGDFYYLETFMNVDTGAPSPVLAGLQQQYYTVCVSQFIWVQVVKFSTRLPAQDAPIVPSCPRATPAPEAVSP